MDHYTSRNWRRSPGHLPLLEQTAPSCLDYHRPSKKEQEASPVSNTSCCFLASLPLPSPAAGGLCLSPPQSVGTPRGSGRAHSGNENYIGIPQHFRSARLQAGSCTSLQELNVAVSTKRRHAVKSGGVRPAGKERTGQLPLGPGTRAQATRRRSGSPTLANPDREATCL